MTLLAPATQKIDYVELTFKAWLAAEELARQANYVAYRQYYEGDQPTLLTQRMRQYLELAANTTFCDNYCGIVADALAERLNVTGFEVDDEGASKLIAQWWRANRMDAQQGDVHTSAVRDGDTYLLVSWDNEKVQPTFTHCLAYDGVAGMHVKYSDGGDQVLWAAKRWMIETGEGAGKRRRVNVYYPDRIEKWVMQRDVDDGRPQPWKDEGDTAWPLPWTGRDGQPLGVPVFHFKNKAVGSQYGLSELAAVIPLQDALNKAIIDYVAAADTTAFQMLFANFDASGLTVAPGHILWGDAESDRMDVIPASNMGGMSAIVCDFVTQIAGVSRTPQYYFQGIGTPPSGESLKSEESGLVAKAQSRQVTFGNAWEDVVRYGLKLEATFGRESPNLECAIDTQWADVQTRNELILLQTLQIKQALGVPKEKLWAEMGYSQDEIDDMVEKADAERAKNASLGSELLKQFEGAPAVGEVPAGRQLPQAGREA